MTYDAGVRVEYQSFSCYAYKNTQPCHTAATADPRRLTLFFRRLERAPRRKSAALTQFLFLLPSERQSHGARDSDLATDRAGGLLNT